MLANVIVYYFRHGGPVMYPILIVAVVAICVVGERTLWWLRALRDRFQMFLQFFGLRHTFLLPGGDSRTHRTSTAILIP